ncbi:ATP-binding cassette sub-family A member like [Heracleum sosnowskyi]|uniref:ATP-binding cassette sub-family A member like n=1 Tax=Heracleum sosnowskyi TaxID=360622 RepID=A0AAD8MDF5_9APIA|nr:ATP-binding cassette sub-family A member like [Heracleum sosnowskyi]
MDREDIGSLGFFGIFKQAFFITTSAPKIYSHLALSIVVRFFFTFLLADTLISDNKYALVGARMRLQRYSFISDIISSEWTTFWLSNVVYSIMFQFLSLISTSAVVYTTACICTTREVTYKKVMQVVPKVWERVLVTFIWNFMIVFALNVIALLVLILWNATLGPSSIGIMVGANLLLIYLFGFVYIGILSHLGSVISVLEDVYGIQAISKSKKLIKGRTGVCSAIFLILNLCFIGIQVGVVGGDSGCDCWGKLWYGGLRLVLESILILYGLVIQTVIYFICKFDHHENIDNSSLADHLEVSRADYVPFEAQDCSLFLLSFLFFPYFGISALF